MTAVIIPVLFWIVIIFIASIASAAKQRNAGRRIVSSDGHEVPPSQDLTCDRYGHSHEESSPEFGRRYIVHEEPEDGYVILNGVKRKISECKYL